MALPVAGYASTLNVGGTSTATTGEATSLFSGAGAATVRQITNAAKRCIDPTVAVIVRDGVTVLTAGTQYVVDYLYGKIRFVSYTPSGAITVDCSYIPLLAVAGVRSISINADRDEIDSTALSNGATSAGESSILGKKKASGEIEYILGEFDDLDPGAGTQTFFAWMNGGASFLLDVQMGPSSSTQGFRAWCKLLNVQRDGISKGSELIGRKLRWHAVNGADDPTKDAFFSTTEAFS